MNEFGVDEEGERSEIVHKVVSEIECDSSGGASSDRYTWHSKVFKVPSSKETLFTKENALRNAKILVNSNIDFANSELGVYNLSNLGYWENTPVLIQDRMEETFKNTLSGKKPTKDTWLLFERAVKISDRAVESEVVLDSSLSNFGKLNDRILFMDIQDGNSIEKMNHANIDEMYEALANSMSRIGVEKSEALSRIDSISRFYTF